MFNAPPFVDQLAPQAPQLPQAPQPPLRVQIQQALIAHMRVVYPLERFPLPHNVLQRPEFMDGYYVSRIDEVFSDFMDRHPSEHITNLVNLYIHRFRLPIEFRLYTVYRQMDQCCALTSTGRQCVNNAKPNEDLCGIHNKNR